MRTLTLLWLAFVFAASAAHAQSSTHSFRDCAGCPEMVLLSPGIFMMGVPTGEEEREGFPEKLRGTSAPLHKVSIGTGIAIGRFDITRAQYAEFVKATERAPGDTCAVWHKDGDHWKVDVLPRYSWANPGLRKRVAILSPVSAGTTQKPMRRG